MFKRIKIRSYETGLSCRTRTLSLRKSSKQYVAARASWVWKSYRLVSGT